MRFRTGKICRTHPDAVQLVGSGLQSFRAEPINGTIDPYHLWPRIDYVIRCCDGSIIHLHPNGPDPARPLVLTDAASSDADHLEARLSLAEAALLARRKNHDKFRARASQATVRFIDITDLGQFRWQRWLKNLGRHRKHVIGNGVARVFITCEGPLHFLVLRKNGSYAGLAETRAGGIRRLRFDELPENSWTRF